MYLALDIGGTNTRIATSRDGENFIEIKIIPTEYEFDVEFEKIQKIALEIAGAEEITEVICGVPGPIDIGKNFVSKFANLPSWNNKPIKETLKNSFNAPVYLENDTALAGLGEACFGAGKNYQNIAYLSFGTGVGGVRIINQKIDSSIHWSEPGHQIITVNGNECGCGGRGHLEAYVSGTAIEKIYGKKAQDIRDEKAWTEIANIIAVGIHNVILHWSPEVVIIGGGIADSLPFEKIESSLAKILKIYPNLPQVLKSKLGDKAGLYGALALNR